MARVTSHISLSEIVPKSGLIEGSTPLSIDEYALVRRKPRVSFVIPVHNQETRVVDCLQGLVKSSGIDHEFIIVIDHSRDNTSDVVHEWARVIESLWTKDCATTRIVIVESIEANLFETVSDNVAFSLAHGSILIEVQADMVVTHPGFDALFCSALDRYPDLFAVSGRGGHIHPERKQQRLLWRLFAKAVERAFSHAALRRGSYRPTRLEYWISKSVGRVDQRIDVPLDPAALRRRPRVYVTETVMRGPLAMRKVELKQLGYLDSDNYFLGNDDHDLIYRATQLGSRSVGYLPVCFDAPLEFGSTRIEKTPEEQTEFNRVREHYEGRQNLLRRNRQPIRPARRRTLLVPMPTSEPE